MKPFPENIVIEEQGPRDGVQSERRILPTKEKLACIDAVVKAGVKRVQVVSFVHPKLVPQMADAEALCSGLRKEPGVAYTGLVLNTKGIERAAKAGLKHVAASISASDTHSRKNANLSLSEARQHFSEMFKAGKALGLTIRGGVQCAFGCRFEGRIDPGVVLDMVNEQLDLGVDEIALADSTGMADPLSMREICRKVLEIAGEKPLFLHLHDTEGKGLANALSAIEVGVRHFDTAFGGMGGCPFIKGASGNISTEDLVVMLHQMGIQTGIDVHAVAKTTRSLEDFFGRSFSGKMHRILMRDDIKAVATGAPHCC
jgi:hydroxymethylglutaryl-CoA lyase